MIQILLNIYKLLYVGIVGILLLLPNKVNIFHLKIIMNLIISQLMSTESLQSKMFSCSSLLAIS